MQKIIPNLWFDKQAEEAANFYVSIFKNSKIKQVSYYGESGAKAANMPAGSVMTVSFELDGVNFMALNGGPVFKFNEAVSFMINCKDQDEVDYFWEKLSEGGKEGVCGWLEDKYGLSWQVVPDDFAKIMKQSSPEELERIMSALLKMKKIEIETLKQAQKG